MDPSHPDDPSPLVPQYLQHLDSPQAQEGCGLVLAAQPDPHTSVYWRNSQFNLSNNNAIMVRLGVGAPPCPHERRAAVMWGVASVPRHMCSCLLHTPCCCRTSGVPTTRRTSGVWPERGHHGVALSGDPRHHGCAPAVGGPLAPKRSPTIRSHKPASLAHPIAAIFPIVATTWLGFLVFFLPRRDMEVSIRMRVPHQQAWQDWHRLLGPVSSCACVAVIRVDTTFFMPGWPNGGSDCCPVALPCPPPALHRRPAARRLRA